MEKDNIGLMPQLVAAGVVSAFLSIGMQYSAPEAFTGNAFVNSLMAGVWGMAFTALFVQFQVAMELRRFTRNLTTASTEAPAEPPKTIEAPAEAPDNAATVEATEVLPEDKKEEPAVPVPNRIILKKKVSK